jgi:hypothetical protein
MIAIQLDVQLGEITEPVRHIAERQLALLGPAGEFWKAGIFAGQNQRSNKS